MDQTAENEEVIDLEETAQVEGEVDEVNGDTPETTETQSNDADDSEVVITLGEESPPQGDEVIQGQPAPDWVKELRKSDKEKARRIRELEQKLEAKQKEAEQLPQLGEEPTLEGCDWDADVFKAEYKAWVGRKAQHDAEQAKAQSEAQAQQAAYENKLVAYKKSASELNVKDFEDAEQAFREATNELQQSVIVKGCKRPAELIYALGKSPTKLKELVAIKDPVDFIFAVAELENKQLKVTPRKAPPMPEKQVTGNSRVQSSDKQLDKLREEAARTGDMSKVLAYRAKQARA